MGDLMRRSKFTDKQIIDIIRESEAHGSDVPKLCKMHNISEPTLYRWKKKFAGADPASVAELKALRSENARMRKLIVDRDLELDVARQLLKKNF